MKNEATGSNPSAASRELSRELADASRLDQYFLVYQPTIDLQTNAFAGVESLIRWRHPVRGELRPDSFIDELEASGQIVEVGRWALSTACAQGAVWHDKGYRFNVSVNVSRRQFELARFIDDVADALSSSRFDPGLLVLEFAQTTLLRERVTTEFRLNELKALGVRIAVDDFEPGESALDELEPFPIDIVKLDREFIAGFSTSPYAASLVHGLVQLSESHHLQVIASGIEDIQQRELLQNENVHVGQGYLFSEPHEAEAIDALLENFAIFSGKPL